MTQPKTNEDTRLRAALYAEPLDEAKLAATEKDGSWRRGPYVTFAEFARCVRARAPMDLAKARRLIESLPTQAQAQILDELIRFRERNGVPVSETQLRAMVKSRKPAKERSAAQLAAPGKARETMRSRKKARGQAEYEAYCARLAAAPARPPRPEPTAEQLERGRQKAAEEDAMREYNEHIDALNTRRR